MKVNYNEISKVYDQVRQADVELFNAFFDEIGMTNSTKILDIGCGTGNYTNILQQLTQARVYGIDPSVGMIERAMQKNHEITFKLADAEAIPFEDGFFDFVYMTDVIHHVPRISAMFKEVHRILKVGGKACIVTQSHAQIAKRYIADFFPGTVAVDQNRYPDIDSIVDAAKEQGIDLLKTETLEEGKVVELGESYLELVEKKGFSMLHLIAPEEYQAGVSKLRTTLQDGPVQRQSAGGTLVWLIRKD